MEYIGHFFYIAVILSLAAFAACVGAEIIVRLGR